MQKNKFKSKEITYKADGRFLEQLVMQISNTRSGDFYDVVKNYDEFKIRIKMQDGTEKTLTLDNDQEEEFDGVYQSTILEFKDFPQSQTVYEDLKNYLESLND